MVTLDPTGKFLYVVNHETTGGSNPAGNALHILRVGPDLGLLGVFDGMGGAGGRVYDTPDGRHTGAWIASRFARNVVERLMLELIKPEWNLDGPATAAELHRLLASSLAARLAELKAPETSLRSKLVKALPTTMTLAVLQRTDPAAGMYACHLFQAGDSRAYVAEPDGGLRQLTTDHLRSGGDAMRNLTDDSVMSNCISADTEFHVNHRQVELQAPFLLLCATDGCFAYVRSPMHFEHLLLSTLQDARDIPAWQQASDAERASRVCLRARPPVPKSCPWALGAEAEQRILAARARTNLGPARLAGLVGYRRSTIYKVLRRHGCSQRRRSAPRQTTRRFEWAQPGALLHIDAMQLAALNASA